MPFRTVVGRDHKKDDLGRRCARVRLTQAALRGVERRWSGAGQQQVDKVDVVMGAWLEPCTNSSTGSSKQSEVSSTAIARESWLAQVRDYGWPPRAIWLAVVCGRGLVLVLAGRWIDQGMPCHAMLQIETCHTFTVSSTVVSVTSLNLARGVAKTFHPFALAVCI